MWDKSYNQFDTHNHFSSPDKVNVTINEHRAPTGDSLKLLEENYDKVRKSLIKHVTVEDNLVTAECYFFENRFTLNDDIILIINFKINGKSFEIQTKIQKRELDYIYSSGLAVGQTCNYAIVAKEYVTFYILHHLIFDLYKQVQGKDLPEHFRNRILKPK
jgi:hypothetical protein